MSRVSQRVIALLTLSLLLFPALIGAQVRASRTVRLNLCTEPEIGSDSKWMKAIESGISKASHVYDSLFDIQFEVRKYSTWNVPAHIQGPDELVECLDSMKCHDGYDVSLGVVVADDEKVDWSTLDKRGCTSILGNRLVVLLSPSEVFDTSRIPLLFMHEFAHLFGAFHSPYANSVMWEYLESGLPQTVFDWTTRQVILTMRRHTFCEGVLSTDQNTREELTRLFDSEHAEGEQNPIGRALLELASRLQIQGKRDSAVYISKIALPYLKCDSPDNIAHCWFVLDVSGQNDSALALSKISEKKYPRNKQIIYNRGVTLLRLNRVFEADSAFIKAISLDSTYSDALFGTAMCKLELGDTTATIQFLNKVIKHKPGHERASSLLNKLGSIESHR